MVELLVVVAITAILCMLLLPVLNRAKSSARRTTCLSNLRQIGIAVLSYSNDSDDKAPNPEGVKTNRLLSLTGYKKMMQGYAGLNRPSATNSRLFACPADSFFFMVTKGFLTIQTEPIHDQSHFDFSSYGFNGSNLDTKRIETGIQRYGIDLARFGIGGQPLTAIKNPSQTIMLAEAPAFEPFSWHQPRKWQPQEEFKFNDAMNVISYVDGHTSYTKIFWTNTVATGIRLGALYQNPPAGYNYKWSRD